MYTVYLVYFKNQGWPGGVQKVQGNISLLQWSVFIAQSSSTTVTNLKKEGRCIYDGAKCQAFAELALFE